MYDYKETLFSRHNRAAERMKSQQLWQCEQNLKELKSDKIQAWNRDVGMKLRSYC